MDFGPGTASGKVMWAFPLFPRHYLTPTLAPYPELVGCDSGTGACERTSGLGEWPGLVCISFFVPASLLFHLPHTPGL